MKIDYSTKEDYTYVTLVKTRGTIRFALIDDLIQSSNINLYQRLLYSEHEIISF